MLFQLKYWSLTILLCLALAIAFERPARAYTDPGSALLLFQSAGAIASGALFYFRRRLKRLFGRKEETPQPPAPQPAAMMTRADS